ncbi:hypothetical protein VTJ83DRAFT_2035 [Remersonia thermophila]|uniref:Nitrogen permease regulator 3 n=1 Tax=Remersonia thermophila TaxID=72144 RepID=A0ABR4DHK6_9PEZI
MASPVLPNPDNFLGVALVVYRVREGSSFVFHYPARLLPLETPGRNAAGRADGDDDADGDDLGLGRHARGAGLESWSSSRVSAAELAQWNHEDHLTTEKGATIAPWEYVAGFPTENLASLLTTGRDYHKKLFQISLDSLYCVSCPIHVPENGVWRKKNKKGPKPPPPPPPPPKDGAPKPDDDDGLPADAGPDKGPTDAAKVDLRDMAKPPAQPAAEETEDKKSSMTMFNLVFFLNPKKHEVKPLVDVMFTHIIKKVNKAYKYCQERSGFVWKESKSILRLKDKGKEERRNMSSLWEEILATSTLAQSMQDVYEAVSQNRIAALQLDTAEGTVTHSVQIPVPFHVSDLPQEGEEGRRGLWLTTANSWIGDEAAETPGFLDKNFALLLMMDEKRVISELQNDPDETTLAMIEFVRHCKPTLSFHQVCQQASGILTPAQVRKFAQHFIFWRRAIAIPPLHPRDTYIVSPNCDMRKLPLAALRWARQFPMAPSLPEFLAMLSVSPRPYKALYNGHKSHRPMYMAMLAWLMRGGWVTQLCTFAYVVVWPEIIYEVDYAVEAEQIARKKREQNTGREPGSLESNDASTTAATTAASSFIPAAVSPGLASPGVAALGDAAVAGFGSGFLSLSDAPEQALSITPSLRDLSLTHPNPLARRASHNTIYSPSPTPPPPPPLSGTPLSSRYGPPPPVLTHLAANLPHDHAPESKPSPTPVEQTAEQARLARIADREARDLAERATAHARKPVPQPTAHPSVNHAPHLDGIQPHVILDAKNVTWLESRYLIAIEQRFRDKAAASSNAGGGSGGGTGAASDPARVADMWPKFCKYFNGRSALERIALQEDMKRKEVWSLLMAMSEYLLCVRHW